MSRRRARATCSWRPSRNSITWSMSARYASLVDGLDAGALAALDVVQQAGPLRAPARPRWMSMVQVRNGNRRRMRFMASSTLLAEAYGPK